MEMAYVIFFNDLGVPLCASVLGYGNQDNCTFDIIALARTGLLVNACSYVLIHNHPAFFPNGENLKSSKPDLKATESIAKACIPIGLHCRDSIVAGMSFQDGREIPACYSIRQDDIRVLSEASLKNKTQLIGMQDALSLGSRALPIYRLVVKRHKYMGGEPLKLLKPTREFLIRELALCQRTADLVILMETNYLPVCVMVSKRAESGGVPFDPACVAKTALLYGAPFYILVHQEPEKTSFKLYKKSGQALKNAREIGRACAPLAVYLTDALTFHITQTNFAYAPFDNLSLFHGRQISELNKLQRKRGKSRLWRSWTVTSLGCRKMGRRSLRKKEMNLTTASFWKTGSNGSSWVAYHKPLVYCFSAFPVV